MPSFDSLPAVFLKIAPIQVAVGFALAILLAGLQRHRRRARSEGSLAKGGRVPVRGPDVPVRTREPNGVDHWAMANAGGRTGPGKRVKSAPFNEKGGRPVRARLETWDRFGRSLGVVTCEGRDIGAWLASEGRAIAGWNSRCKTAGRDSQGTRRSMIAREGTIALGGGRRGGRKPA